MVICERYSLVKVQSINIYELAPAWPELEDMILKKEGLQGTLKGNSKGTLKRILKGG